jgi:hypothetical protein
MDSVLNDYGWADLPHLINKYLYKHIIATHTYYGRNVFFMLSFFYIVNTDKKIIV